MEEALDLSFDRLLMMMMMKRRGSITRIYYYNNLFIVENSGVPRNFFRLGVQQFQFGAEDRENGDLGAVAP